tara:strand:- start:333 stop:551 length:219 start_codon:yes stop_codon:yes gene_type:complete
MGEKTTIFIYICEHLCVEGCMMESKNITLRVSSNLYDKYRDFCKKKGWLISRQFEIMMEEQLKEIFKKNEKE